MTLASARTGGLNTEGEAPGDSVVSYTLHDTQTSRGWVEVQHPGTGCALTRVIRASPP